MNPCARSSHRYAFGIIVALAITTLFGSCSAPFTVDILARAEDQSAPVVTVTSPENESFYAKAVTVTGTVADATDNEEVAGVVSSLRYEISAASIAEDVEIGAEGEFTFSFSTTAFTGGTIAVRVIATDSNGNEGIASRSLLYGGSDIATFEAVPGNQQVTLEWDAVPTATGYTVKNLGAAEQVVLDAEVSSYTWEDLRNGDLYFFQLEATDGSGETNISSEVSVIPLSAYTLLPSAYSYDDRVLVTWRPMPGITTYVVEKATSIDGPYLKRFETNDTRVEDTLLVRDQYYYYRIYPDLQDQIKSAAVEAVLLPFSVTGTEPGNYFGPLVNSRIVRNYGNYVIINDRDTDNFSYIRILDASDPANLVEVGNLNTGDPPYMDMVVDEIEQLLYIAEEEQGVLVVDISDPASPSLVTLTVPAGRFLGEPAATADPVNGVYSFNALGITRGVSNTFIFGLGYDTNIYSARVDRSGNDVTLAATQSVGPFGAAGDTSDAMAIHGSTAYVSYRDTSVTQSGFRIFDVSDPETSISSVAGAPALVSGISPGNSILVTDDYVFLERRTTTLQYFVRVLDVADSYNEIASYEFPVRVQNLTLANDTLFVSAGSSRIQGFDVSTPPAGTGATPAVVPEMAGPAYSSVVQGDYLVVAGLTGIESFHLLPAIGYGSVKNVIGTYYNMKDFVTIGNEAHVLGLGSSFPPATAGFYTADLTSPEALSSLNLVSGLDGGSQVILQGDREMLFSTSLDSVRFISPPSAADPVVSSEFTHNARELYSIGDVTYGILQAIVSIYDTSDSNNVTQIRSIGFDNNVIELAARGDYMYAAYLTDWGTRSSGIIVLDISDPIYPVEVYRIIAGPTIGFHDMELFGDELYVPFSDDGSSYRDGTDDSSGLRIYSLADDPEQPSLVGTYPGDAVFAATDDWSKRFEHIEVRGHLVALSSGQSANSTRYKGRVVLVNVDDPSSIVKVKDVLPDAGHGLPGTTPDFPQVIHFWRGAYVFVMGRNELTVYEM